jgi:hypothetical protein
MFTVLITDINVGERFLKVSIRKINIKVLRKCFKFSGKQRVDFLL